MNKNDIVAIIQEDVSLSPKQSRLFIEVLLRIIKEEVSAGRSVLINDDKNLREAHQRNFNGLGYFHPHLLKGIYTDRGSRIIARFTPSEYFKEEVDELYIAGDDLEYKNQYKWYAPTPYPSSTDD